MAGNYSTIAIQSIFIPLLRLYSFCGYWQSPPFPCSSQIACRIQQRSIMSWVLPMDGYMGMFAAPVVDGRKDIFGHWYYYNHVTKKVKIGHF